MGFQDRHPAHRKEAAPPHYASYKGFGDTLMPEKMRSKIKVLILGEDSEFSKKISSLLADDESRSRNICQVVNLQQALAHLKDSTPQIIFTSLSTLNIIEAIKNIRKATTDTPVIALGRKGEEKLAMEAVKSGVQDCIFFESFEDQNLYQTVQFAIERRRIASEIDRAHQSQLKSVIEGVSDGVMILSAEKITIFVNPAAERILNAPITELMGKSPPISFELGSKICQTLEQDNKKKHLEISTSLLPWDDGEAGFCITIHDVTEHKLLQDQLKNASNLKDEFIAHMSHELRTPMNGIVGMTSLLEESGLNKNQLEYTKTIKKSSSNMLEMISDLLDLSKIEAGRLHIENTTFNLRSLIEDTFDIFAADTKKKGIILSNYYPSNVPSYVQTDSSRLRQIIVNLLSNAIRHTDNGFVRIETNLIDNKIQLAIVDSGIGIPRELQNQLFKPFNQLSSSPEKRQGGTGLGLVICKKISNLIGGDVYLKSSSSKGSIFCVDIPTSIKKSSSSLKKSRSKIHCLIKNKSILESIKMSFKSYGYDTVELEKNPAEEPKIIVVEDEFNPDPNYIGELRSQYPKSLILLLIESQASIPKDFGCYLLPKNPLKQSQVLKYIKALKHGKTPTHSSSSPSIKDHEFSKYNEVDQNIDGRVLVAEDNITNQKVIASMLTKIGLNVDTVANGKEAIEACKMMKYDCILMDCRMPLVNGFDATRSIRSISDHYEDIPIIAVTAEAFKNNEHKCKSYGMDGCLIKPVDLNALRKLLKSKLVDRNSNFFYIRKKDDSNLVLIDEEVLETLLRVGEKCGNNLLSEVVGIFKHEFPQILEDLEKTSLGNPEEIENLAHKLKGSARNIGASRLAGKCGDIESIATNQTALKHLASETAEIRECFFEVCAFLDNYLEHSNSSKVG